MRRPHSYTTYTRAAITLLGSLVAQARRERGWTLAELATRCQTSVSTMRKVERGQPDVAIGIAFEAAAILQIPLFDPDPAHLAALGRQADDRLRLLPQRIRVKEDPVDDNF